MASEQTGYFGDGAITEIPRILEGLRGEKVLLVVDRPAYEMSGAAAAVKDCFSGRQVEFFDGFELNPKIEDIERGVELFRGLQPHVVLAIGGGSAIDVAKVIGACGANNASPREYVSGQAKLVNAGPPLIAVPTRAGTGSEATHFAVAYIAGQKYSLAHPTLMPKFTVLDPILTYSLPAKVTAASGLDAMCQAIESIWAVGSTPLSVGYATLALEYAWANLPSAVLHPTAFNRESMMKAACSAGAAINIGKTTAPHAFSYAITSRYKVPHGTAVALSLGPFLRYNAAVDETTCADPRGVDYVRERIQGIVRILGGHDPESAATRFESLLDESTARRNSGPWESQPRICRSCCRV